jgi:CelD/BcsL family acetyltransferase involved in cellulose biosynthesis
MAGAHQIEFHPDYDMNALAMEWQGLEKQARASFFLSWTWISTWLESVAERPMLVRVRSGTEITALGLLGRANIVRHLFVRSRQLHLHQSGSPDLDRITIEFNGFLVRQGLEADVVPQIFRRLVDLTGPWDECVLPGVPAQYMAFGKGAGYACTTDRRSPNFLVNLEGLRQQKLDLTQTLSRNSRAQLRRALRLAGTEGPLHIHAASDLEEALSYFAALKNLDRRRGGAFATVARDQFHRRLIARGWGRGEVELLRASAGNHTIGYLYQFSYRGQILSYQIAYAPGKDNRHHPGIVMHYLAIERAKTCGGQTYDFLAGQARYKNSLGDEGEKMLWLRLQKPRPSFWLERALSRMRDAM